MNKKFLSLSLFIFLSFVLKTEAALWSPAEISTAAWYDASDASTLRADTGGTIPATTTVARWNDKSGNGNNATQATAGSRPTINTYTINGTSTVSFRVAGLKWLQAPHHASLSLDSSGGLNIFSVMRYPGYASQGSTLNAALIKGANGLSATTGYGFTINSSNILSYKTGTSANTNSISTLNNQDILVSGIKNSSTSSMYVNGSLNNTGTAAGSDNTSPLTMGRDPSNNTRYADIDYGEIIIMGGNITTDTRQKIEGYLAWKWGLESNLPANHPYKNAAPDSTSLSVPSNLAASLVSTSTLTLSWNTVSGADGYEISGDNGFATTTTASASINISSLTPNTLYNFNVKAYDSNSTSTSATISVNTLPDTSLIYTFESDTVGQAASGITPIDVAYTDEVANHGSLGKSLHVTSAVTGGYFTLDNFITASDYSVTWKEKYDITGGRHGFLLRASGTDGYLFQVNHPNNGGGAGTFNSLRIYKRVSGTYTQLSSDISFTFSISPRWFKASVSGTTLSFYSSTDGINFTLRGSVTDSTLTSGGVQYTTGFADQYADIYVDNIIQDVSGGITITSPKSYQVIQRNNSNQADINISGTYSGIPTAIEASWNGGVYQVIDASPTGGTYSGTLSNQTGGQGTLNVRFSNDINKNASNQYVGIGDIFVIAGQSNASGRGTSNQVYSHPTLKGTLFGNDDVWKELLDPTDSNSGQVDAISVETATIGGSVWPLIATYYLNDQSVPVAFIPTAKGGTSITEWQPDPSASTLYGSMARRINAVGGDVKAVLFFQGESDTSMAPATYLTQLTNFTDEVFTQFGARTVVGQIGNQNLTASNLDNIRTIQITGWDTVDSILPGGTSIDIDKNDEGGDGTHYKSNGDLALWAERWWAAIENNFYNGADGRGPRFVASEENAARTQVVVTFEDETFPLIPSTGFTGFIVKDDGTPVSVSSMSVVEDNAIRLVLASPLTGTATVSFGSGTTVAGQIIPTDSSAYNLPIETFINKSVSTSTSATITITAPTLSANETTITDTTIIVEDNLGINADDVVISAINTTGSFSISNINCLQTTGVRVDCDLQVDANIGTGDIQVQATDIVGNVSTETQIGYSIIPVTYILSYISGSNGSITGSTTQAIIYGGNGTEVTAVPNINYHFVSWSDGATSTSRTDTNVTNDLTLTATFAIYDDIITYLAGSNGTLTGSTTQEVSHGASTTPVTAVPNTGYHFVDWSDGSTSNPRYESYVNGPLSVTANFAINTYTFSYSAGSNGTLTGSTTQVVDYGADGTVVTAVPNTGHHFIQWNDGVLTASRTDTNATSSITVTANFDADTYTLSYTVGSGGTLTGSTNQTVAYDLNGTTVTAVPQNGYNFMGWSDGIKTASRTDLNIIGNISVTANFEKTPRKTSGSSVKSRITNLIDMGKTKEAQTLATKFPQVTPSQTTLNTNTFTRDLEITLSGEDVKALQNILISKGYSIPAGATGYFGGQTQAALIKYQQDNKITPAAGYFGPRTRAILK